MQEVKRPHAQLGVGDIAKVESAKIRQPALVAGRELAVDEDRTDRQGCDGSGDCRKDASIVVSGLGVDRNVTLALVQLDAPAVEFDFVQPLLARGRRISALRGR